MNKFLLGRKGEDEAVRFLQDNGYRIVARNVRAKFGEIDVVARDGAALCFVEIKARSGLRFGFPEEALTAEKRRRLIRLVQWYLQRSRPPAGVSIRFDVLSILTDSDPHAARIRLIKGAFEAA